MVRNIGAVMAGMLVVLVVVVALQSAGMLMYPPPDGFDPGDPDPAAMAGYLEAMPLAMWLWVLSSEVIGAFLGAYAAGRIATQRRPLFAGIIVAVALAGSINNWVSFAHPAWFIVSQPIAYAAAFFVVVRLLPAGESSP